MDRESPEAPKNPPPAIPAQPEMLGRFRPVAFLGRGSFGEVWRVEDPLRPGIDLAIKMLGRGSLGGLERRRPGRPPDPRQAALREFRIGFQVRHPVVIEPLEMGTIEGAARPGGPAPGAPYILSEFFDGAPLGPTWMPGRLAPVAGDLLSALAAIHAAGWRHGDLHPGNILVRRGRDGDPAEVRLLDFGLAQEIGQESGARAGGTPLYLAPEVLRGEAPDHRADLYALGLILYQCLRGRITEPLGEHLRRTRDGALLGEARAAGIPGALGRLITGLLEPDPSGRLQSGAEGLKVLDREGGSSRAAQLALGAVPAFESSRLIGREEVAGDLEAALAAARSRRPRPAMVLLEGGEGLGKSRLVREAIAAAFSAGARGMTWEMARALAGAPAAGESLPEQAPVAGRGDAAWHLPGETAEAAAAGERAERLAESLLERLGTGPALIGIDDYHLLPVEDRLAVVSLIEKLRAAAAGPRRARRAGHFPVLVVSAEGAVEIPDLPWITRRSLAPWSGDASSRYLDRVLPPRRSLGPIEETLRRQAAGIPGRWRAILRELARLGELRLEGGVWTCSRAPARGPVALPGERERFIEEWERLDEAARQILAAAALLSESQARVPLELIAAALGAPPAAAGRALARLRGGEIIAAGDSGDDPAAGPARGIRLARRLRAWILRRLGPPARRALRERIAQAPVPPLPALLQRLRLGEPVGIEELLAAAGADPPGAPRLLALHALRAPAPRAERSRSALALGELLQNGGEPARAVRFLRLAAALAAEEGTKARAGLLLAEAAVARGDGEEACRAVRAARSLAAEGGEAAVRLAAATVVAEHLTGHADLALEAAERGAQDHPELPIFQFLRGNILLAAGDLEGSERALAAAVQAAEARGLPRECGSARTNFGRLIQRLGRAAEAAEMHRRAAAESRQAGARAQEALALANLGAALRRAGDHEGSVQATLDCLAIRRQLGDLGGTAIAEANLGILARELGLPGTARRRFETAAEAAARAGAPVASTLQESIPLLVSRALLALDIGKLDEAEELARAARQRRGGTPPDGDGLLLEARLAAAGRVDLTALARALHSRNPGEGDAPGLAQIARLAPAPGTAPAQAEAAALSREARDRLGALAAASPRAAFHHRLLELETGAEGEDRERILRSLAETAGAFPERDARRRALAALCRGGGEEGERARARLRQLLDEVSFDLESDDREAYRSRPEIQEALDMVRAPERTDPDSARAGKIIEQVFRLNREILLETRLEELLRKIVDAAVLLTGAERGVLALRRGGSLSITAARSGEKDIPDPSGQISRTILDRALAEGKAQLATDAREDAALRSIASVEELGLRSVICVPLRVKRSVIGALYLDNTFERGVFVAADLQVVESFCGQAALAWARAEDRRRREDLLEELRRANERLGRELELERRDAARRGRIGRKEFHGMVGDSPRMRELFHLIEAVAPADIPVLITGESGTGKELVARAIARLSPRAQRPFVAENCGAVPASLLESALFGHTRGAFTGADRDRQGLFEMASGGTLFLDEILELSPELQTRLLRVLQEGEVRPLGSTRLLDVDVRIIAATNRDVRRAMAEGTLREDLYYRLQGAEIRVPPLRDRKEDIPLLVDHFQAQLSSPDGSRKRLAAETLERLMRYPWPGNVRELENEVRRLFLLAPGEIVGPELLSPQVREGWAPPGIEPAGTRPVRPLAEVEREAIVEAMRQFNDHRGKAAEALGISRSTLYLKLREYGQPPSP